MFAEMSPSSLNLSSPQALAKKNGVENHPSPKAREWHGKDEAAARPSPTPRGPTGPNFLFDWCVLLKPLESYAAKGGQASLACFCVVPREAECKSYWVVSVPQVLP